MKHLDFKINPVQCSDSSINTKLSNIPKVSQHKINSDKNSLQVSEHKKVNVAKKSGKVFSFPNIQNLNKINSTSKVATSRTTRLETLMLDIFNETTGNTEKVRAFLDGGSQMTVVSTECATRCGLKLGDPETMMLSTFGQKVSKERINTTSFNLYRNSKNFSDKLQVNAYVMDRLVHKIKSIELSERQKNYVINNEIRLSDVEASTGISLNVDILIGQDYINEFYKGEAVQLPGGSFLKPTWEGKFILSGPVDHEQIVDAQSNFEAPRFLKLNSAFKTEIPDFQKQGFSKRLSSLIKNVYSSLSSEEELEIIDKFVTFELLGISPLDYKISPISETFNEQAELKEGRYWVRLPFKEKAILKQLSNNFFQAFSRLLSGHKRRQKPKFADEAEKYEQSFKTELDLGILEKVDTLGTIQEVCEILASNPQHFNQIKLPNGRPACYLPHQAVKKASTGKFRRVHDGSAKPYKGAYSINDVLEKGPNLTASILHILLGFRKHKYAAKADIEKAFPQVGIAEEDRDVLRCLWIEDDKVVVYRFARLPFGLSCSPFILAATLRLHLKENEITEDVFQSFIASVYVDDWLKSEASLEKLKKAKHHFTELFKKCGMLFRDWNSNDSDTREEFAKQENRKSVVEEVALGMFWDTNRDILRVNSDRLKEKIKKPIRTKRDLWKIIPSIYDPIGFLSPYVVLGKAIVAKACRLIKSWDARLPDYFRDLLLRWASEFDQIECMVWDRFAGIENPKRTQLYGCCDASNFALGACIYLVSTAQNGEITIKLILSKTRNAAQDEHSIPRLELASAVVLTNMMQHARKIYPEISDQDITLFTDSANVLFWLYSGHLSWKPFVAHQLKKIRKSTDVNCWRHIDTKENPADLASRGETLKNLIKSDFWNSGPSFWKSGDLNVGASEVSGYDNHYSDLKINDVCAKEMEPAAKRQLEANAAMNHDIITVSSLFQCDFPKFCANLTVGLGNKPLDKPVNFKLSLPKIDKIVDISNLLDSSYDYVMRISEIFVKFAKGFVEVWKNKLKGKGKPIPTAFVENKLSFCKESNVELMWIQATQRKYFSEVFLFLENPKARISSYTKSLVVSHSIFLDKEMKVLRCTTRNEKSMISYSGVYPILLPSSVRTAEGEWEDCPFTKMLVLKRHADIGHQGVPDTLSNIRSEFWVLKGRSFVQRIIKKCVICAKVQGSRYSVPPSPALPEFRVVRNKPFAGTGVDFLGPFKCRDTLRSKPFKAWYLSFVCGSTRAVHVEAVRSRKIDDFLQAMSRFMNQNGIPESFISDHEKSFVRGSQELEQIVGSKRVQDFLKNKRISWNFYTEKSPNKGGFIERLNSNIKRTFFKTVGKQTSSFEEFRTLATYVSSNLNDRPLSYILSNIRDQEMALTPSMLIRGFNLGEPPHLNYWKQKDKTETKLSDSFHLSEKLKNKFWRIFYKQYLSDLFERHTREKKSNKQLVVPEVGEVCLIAEDKLPRRQWRLGRVVSINEKRGVVREVVVQTLSAAKNAITKLKRSPNHLVPIGVKSEVRLSSEKVIPMEFPNEKVSPSPSQKYSKQQLYQFKRRKIFPPYKPSKQFLDPSSINTGPDPDYINKDGTAKEIKDELPRIWRSARSLFSLK